MTIQRRALAIAFLAVLAATPALAQSTAQAADDWSAARWRFGPLAVTPKIDLKNLGWDSNVFNETEDPKSDFTTTVGAPIDWWLRFGRGRLHGVNYFEGVYFATYANQRGFNQRHELTLLLPLNRIQPYVGGSYFSTNDRPGYEINARIRHTEQGVNAGVVVRLASRIDLDVSGRQTAFRYEEDASAGTVYAESLDRDTESYGAQLRYSLTSQTTLTLLAGAVNERYIGSPDRDNDGFRILPGVEFGNRAIITGKAQVGYRQLNTLTSGMPDFSGLVANAELSYTLRGTTRLTAGFSRDIFFSFELNEPFYIQPGFTVSVTQQIRGPWDIQARGAWRRLEYQRAEIAESISAAGRVDRYTTWGGGIGYRLGRHVRLGFNVDYSHRQSVVVAQNFEGTRGGISVTYTAR